MTPTPTLELAAPGLDLILSSPDPTALGEFYVGALGGRGLVDARPWDAPVAVAFGAQVIAIRPSAHGSRLGPRGVYAAHGLRVVALQVGDVPAVRARLDALGRKVSPPASHLPGSRPVAFARDPDGNTLELIDLEGAPRPDCPLQVGLSVRDAERSAVFYGDSLGLPAQPRVEIEPGVIRHGFDVGASTIKFWTPPARAAAVATTGDDVGIACVALRVASLSNCARALDARGLVASRRGAGLSFADPDGDCIELFAAT